MELKFGMKLNFRNYDSLFHKAEIWDEIKL
jgi:hypothetical protein